MDVWNTHDGRVILIALCVASTLSFLPQLLRITASRDSSGLSIAYVLLNLTSATHQLALGGGYIGFADVEPIRGVFVWSWPQNVTDWVNLAQLLTFWVGTLALFVACLFTPPHSLGVKAWAAVIIYLAVLMTTIVPSLVLINAPEEHDGTAPTPSGAGMFFPGNNMFIVPPVTLLTVASFYFEARAILSQPAGDDGIGSVSQTGLLVQAVVFAAVALSWVHRVSWPADRPGIAAGLWMGWYRLIGWGAVNNAIFAAGQAYLWFLVRGRASAPVVGPSGEAQPLLG